MPRKAEWIHRIGQAVTELESIQAPLIDRAAVERLLGVSPRQALRILNGLSAQPAGRNLLIGRRELIDKLNAVATSGQVQWEHRRRERVETELHRLRKAMAARGKTLPVDREPPRLPGLPQGVRLEPGRLEIRFQTGDELLGRLFELAQAVADNPADFHSAVGE